MKRLVCAIRHRPSGTAEALSSTPDLPTVTALLAAAGEVTVRRASDVASGSLGHVAVVRPWVTGEPVPLPVRATREAAIEEEVRYLTAAMDLPPVRP